MTARSGARGREFVIVDVFTDRPLQGNQLAVFTDASGLVRTQMQRLAREFNFSETVFLLPPRGDGDVRIRIFTPRHELAFAGHPTLGAAVVAGAGRDRLALETGLGLVPVELERRGSHVFGRMEQRVPKWAGYESALALLLALGVKRSLLPVEAYLNGPLHVFVRLEDEDAVASLKPDPRALSELPALDGRRPCANCFAGSGRTWTTRMFAPAGGVPEDPATGSAAGPLAVHLSRHGQIAFGTEITIHQGRAVGRPSVLFARAEGSGDEITGVQVAGASVVVARGRFHVQ